MRARFRAGLYTGMRLHEVRNLRWEHVDFLERAARAYRTETGEPLIPVYPPAPCSARTPVDGA